MKKLCLNMIVRNEADKIERCLASVAPYISCYSITDTGSTDDTVHIIQEFFHAHKIPGLVHVTDFVNFEQARNDALRWARRDKLEWDYLLLADADMELKVEDKNFTDQLTGQSHTIVQTNSGLSYHNARFISRAATGNYIGVTHEYLDIPTSGCISGVSFDDHADGSNRKDKFKRDIRLLKEALKTDPNNGRSWFYLAQSYKDNGEYSKAAHAYQRRIDLGGWDEEVWYSRMQLAYCHQSLGNTEEFVDLMLRAYSSRPSRPEPLWALSSYYRQLNLPRISLLFAEEGLRIPPTKDVLFVNDYVIKAGMREEYSISGFYDEARRSKAFGICNDLALDPTIPWGSRNLARQNLFHYVRPLCESVHSFVTRQIPFVPPDGFTAMNPCVTIGYDNMIVCLVRSVNYTMDEHGRYLIKSTNGEANQTNPINTRNFLVSLRNNFDPAYSLEVLPPEGFPLPQYPLVTGFEDMRIFMRQGELCSISNVREQNPEGWCEQYFATIADNGHLDDYRMITPAAPRQHEKNWMPIPDTHDFVYRLGTLVGRAGVLRPCANHYATDNISGGSQAIPLNTNHLAVVHEAYAHPSTGKRYYIHRFVLFDVNMGVQRISRPFVFHDKVIEFAAGLALHPDGKRLMISYGREDKEAWIATVDWHDVMEFLNG